MSIEQFDVGNHVECDGCGKDFTESDESGGLLFGSKAYAPCCAARMEEGAVKYAETEYIRGRCPPGMLFREWVLRLRGGDNTITFLSGADCELYLDARLGDIDGAH